MRVKEAITKIKQHQNWIVLKRLFGMNKDEAEASCMYSQIQIQPNYSKQRFWYIVDNLTSSSKICGLPVINIRRKFDFGEYKTTAFINIGINPYARHKPEIETSLRFYIDGFDYLMYKSHFELPMNLDLDNPDRMLFDILKKVIIPEGVVSFIQYRRQYTIREAVSHYKRLYCTKLHKNVSYGGIGIDKLEKWIEKNFNVVVNGHINEAIKFVNKRGKQKDKVYFNTFDISFMNDFDGDVDELETAFWEEMENYPENTILI